VYQGSLSERRITRAPAQCTTFMLAGAEQDAISPEKQEVLQGSS